MSASQTVFKCPLCAHFQATEFKLLLPHIRLVHSTRPGFRLQCPFGHCTRSFTNMKSYMNHLYSEHMGLPTSTSTYQSAGSIDTSLMGVQEEEGGEEEEMV